MLVIVALYNHECAARERQVYGEDRYKRLTQIQLQRSTPGTVSAAAVIEEPIVTGLASVTLKSLSRC